MQEHIAINSVLTITVPTIEYKITRVNEYVAGGFGLKKPALMHLSFNSRSSGLMSGGFVSDVVGSSEVVSVDAFGVVSVAVASVVVGSVAKMRMGSGSYCCPKPVAIGLGPLTCLSLEPVYRKSVCRLRASAWKIQMCERQPM